MALVIQSKCMLMLRWNVESFWYYVNTDNSINERVHLKVLQEPQPPPCTLLGTRAAHRHWEQQYLISWDKFQQHWVSPLLFFPKSILDSYVQHFYHTDENDTGRFSQKVNLVNYRQITYLVPAQPSFLGKIRKILWKMKGSHLQLFLFLLLFWVLITLNKQPHASFSPEKCHTKILIQRN